MTSETTFEQEIMALIADAEEERRKLLQRIANAERAIVGIDGKLNAYQTTLAGYRQKYGVKEQDLILEADRDLVESMRSLGTREMLIAWARAHRGDLVVNDMVKAATAAELFHDREQAAGTLYATLSRMSGTEKVARGHYRLESALSEAASQSTNRVQNGRAADAECQARSSDDGWNELSQADDVSWDMSPEYDSSEPTSEDLVAAQDLFRDHDETGIFSATFYAEAEQGPPRYLGHLTTSDSTGEGQYGPSVENPPHEERAL